MILGKDNLFLSNVFEFLLEISHNGFCVVLTGLGQDIDLVGQGLTQHGLQLLLCLLHKLTETRLTLNGSEISEDRLGVSEHTRVLGQSVALHSTRFVDIGLVLPLVQGHQSEIVLFQL